MKLFEQILSFKNNKTHKIITILGIKFKFLNIRSILAEHKKETLLSIQRLITISKLHEKTFTEYKNLYSQKTVVLMGAGPTVNKFEPVKDAIYVGCNRAFLFKKVKFDYLFSIDKAGIEQYYKDFLNYQGNNCVKFLGDQNLGKNFQIPESYISKLQNVKRYKTNANLKLGNRLSLDINCEPLANFSSVALQAMQFILYTNPKTVYLVGIDCTIGSQGHFIGDKYDSSQRGENIYHIDDLNKKAWLAIKQFVSTYYPETEIISINPVGLKGLFKDVYTDSYISEHPEITNVEVLDYEK